jgi:hypothetical protein
MLPLATNQNLAFKKIDFIYKMAKNKTFLTKIPALAGI